MWPAQLQSPMPICMQEGPISWAHLFPIQSLDHRKMVFMSPPTMDENKLRKLMLLLTFPYLACGTPVITVHSTGCWSYSTPRWYVSFIVTWLPLSSGNIDSHWAQVLATCSQSGNMAPCFRHLGNMALHEQHSSPFDYMSPFWQSVTSDNLMPFSGYGSMACQHQPSGSSYISEYVHQFKFTQALSGLKNGRCNVKKQKQNRIYNEFLFAYGAMNLALP